MEKLGGNTKALLPICKTGVIVAMLRNWDEMKDGDGAFVYKTTTSALRWIYNIWSHTTLSVQILVTTDGIVYKGQIRPINKSYLSTQLQFIFLIG